MRCRQIGDEVAVMWRGVAAEGVPAPEHRLGEASGVRGRFRQAGPASEGPVLLRGRGCVGRGRQCRLQHPRHLHDDGITLWMPFREVKALLVEGTRLLMETAPLELGLQGRANLFLSTESESPKTCKVSEIDNHESFLLHR